MDTQNIFDRRTVLKGLPIAALAAGAATVKATADEVALLNQLIDAHRAAHEEMCAALAAWDMAKSAFNGRENPRVPISICADGSRLSGYYELGPLSESEIRKKIVDAHARFREIHCGRWAMSMVPEFTAAVEKEVAAAEQRSLAMLDSIVEQQKAEYLSLGVKAADQEVKRTCAVERRAIAGLLAYRPNTDQEREIKTDYVTAHEDHTGVPVTDDEDAMSMLVDLLNEVA